MKIYYTTMMAVYTLNEYVYFWFFNFVLMSIMKPAVTFEN